MAQSLKSLVRLHEWKVDETRRQVRILADERDALNDRLVNLEMKVETEKKIAQKDPQGAGRFFHAFMEESVRRRNALEQALTDKDAEIEAAREALNAAYRELKTYELTESNRDDARRREEERKEQAILDEIGQERYRRSKRSSS